MPEINQTEIQTEEEAEETETRLEQLKRIARQQAKEKAKQVVKQAVKKAASQAVKKFLITLISNPYFWAAVGIILGIIALIALIILILSYFQQNPCAAVEIAGQVEGNLITKALGVVCEITGAK